MPKRKTVKKTKKKLKIKLDRLDTPLYFWTTKENGGWARTMAKKRNLTYSRFINGLVDYARKNNIVA